MNINEHMHHVVVAPSVTTQANLRAQLITNILLYRLTNTRVQYVALLGILILKRKDGQNKSKSTVIHPADVTRGAPSAPCFPASRAAVAGE